MVRLLCGGCAVQWRHGSTSACCLGVAALGESLAGAGRPAATAPVGVVIILGGVIGNFIASTRRSISSGESPDPAAGSGGGVVLNIVPIGASYDWTCTVTYVATMTVVSMSKAWHWSW